MGCPVHIWVPLMAGLAPVARIARDRFLASRPRSLRQRGRPTGEVRTVRRFAPVGAASQAAAEAAAPTEQAR